MGTSLREVFTPLFSYVLLFFRSAAPQRSYQDLRDGVQRLIAEQADCVKRHDISAQDYDSARFAVIAWVDEMVLRNAVAGNREIYDHWKRAPLQVELYNTANAGEEFFERLERLAPAQNAVREVYHLCLCLGFRGRYYDDAQEHKLLELRRELAHHLQIEVGDLYEIEKKQERLTPQPYSVSAPPPRRSTRGGSYAWIAALALLPLGALLYVLLTPQGRSADEVLADVRQRLAPFDCVQLTIDEFRLADGVLRLGGRVQSDEQRESVRRAAASVPEVKRVEETFRIVPRPFCQVVDLLQPVVARADGARLAVRPRNGCDAVYVKGDSLVITISAARPLRYVYADYFTADRENVAHLLPNPNQQENFFKADTEITLGAPGTEPQWQVQPPFGTELITVIASAQPLIGSARSLAEPDAGYIDQLRRALQQSAAGDVAAAYCFITTQDR